MARHQHSEEEEELNPASPTAANGGPADEAAGGVGGAPSLEDLASFFERAGRAALSELRNPEDVARKLRERVLAVTAVHIHRDRKKAAAIDTIDYMPQDSEVYRRWLHTQPLQRLWDRWAMMFIVGFVVGLCAFFLHSTFHTIASVKVDTLRVIIEYDVFLAWMFNVTYSCLFVAISAASVLWISPAAAGSGVPEVMAYLNGCLLPKLFEWKTTAIKFLSCACCVGAGLPVGPEGPMIFLGATLGGLVSQGTVNAGLLPRGGPREQAEAVLNMVGGSLWPFKRFRNKVDQRDFMTAGCAAGVAGAFGAPIGGLLFAMEEVASFWNITLGWQIFFACMTAVFARAFAESLGSGETPGLFSNTITYETTKTVKTHVYAMAVAVFVGAACGLTAALFTRTNLKISQWRAQYVGADRRKRFIEPMVYMFVFATIAMTLPFAFTCRETACFVDPEAPGGLGYTCRGAPLNPLVMPTVVETTMETFICRSDVQASFRGHGNAAGGALASASVSATTTETSAGGQYVYKYNELATLMGVSGNEALVHLLSRNTHLEFGFASVCIFFLIYYLFAAMVAGSCIASGLFVPMLLMGACIGRFWGLVAVKLALHFGITPEQLFTDDTWFWVDPGVFAMVGAGAYMAGVSRLTLSLAVIVIEMTNEVHFLLPLLLAIMVAKWVADALEHALYHSLLEFKNVPFLPATPFGGATLDMLSVRDIMCQGPISVLHETESLVAATDMLRRTKMHAFPVVRRTFEGDVYVGMMTREHLTMVLYHAAMVQSGQAPRGCMVSYDQLEGKAPVVRSAGDEGGGGPGGGAGGGGGGGAGGAAAAGGRLATSAGALKARLRAESTKARSMEGLAALELKVLSGAHSGGGGGGGAAAAPAAAPAAAAAADDPEQGPACAAALAPDTAALASLLAGEVDLRAYVNRSGIAVPHHFSAMRAFILFRSMGLRHLPVVDEHNHVVGIVTRKELLDESLGEKLHALGLGLGLAGH